MAHTHEDIQDLLGVYALHALEPDEAQLVEEHLEVCPRCRSEVQGHREVATMLGNTGGDAPEGLWDRISSQLEESPPPMRLALPEGEGSVIPLAPRRRRSSGFVAVALSAAAALVIGVLGVQVVRQEDRINSLNAALEDDAVLTAANLALADPDAAKVQLASSDGTVAAPAVLLPNGTGYLLAHQLEELDASLTYQLWGVTDTGVVSLGLLGASPNDVVSFQISGDVSGFAVTAEVAGGVAQSVNPAVVAGELG
ncbi:MAG: anti-sigma factor domain-containing protein [Acidimicrobiales bacterium]